jgi:hypothetical protein
MDKRRIPCPKCKQEYRVNQLGNKIPVGPFLHIDETNYHGCNEDLASCEECDGEFFISYKIDQIIECDWTNERD